MKGLVLMGFSVLRREELWTLALLSSTVFLACDSVRLFPPFVSSQSVVSSTEYGTVAFPFCETDGFLSLSR